MIKITTVDCMTEDCAHWNNGCTMPFVPIVNGQCGSYEEAHENPELLKGD